MNTATAAAEAKTPNRAGWLMQRVTTFPVLLSAALTTLVFWRCGAGIVDPDIWWHLRNAQYFVTHLRFPNIDAYSFTAAGTPWMNHEWLSELFYYAGFRALGLTGILVVFATALSAMMVAVFWLSLKESGDALAAFLVTLVGAVLALVGFGPRTQHFGWLCFLAMYAILLHFRSHRQAPLWALPLIFCIWINCHGSWLIGLTVFAIFVFTGLIPRDIGHLAADRWSKAELKKLTLAGIASVAALFASPFGHRLVLYPFEFIFRLRLNQINVEEFASVNFRDPRGKLVALVLLAVFAAALAGRKRWRFSDAALVAFAVYCGVTHVRFLLLAGIMLPPILAPQLGPLSSYDGQHERRLANAVLLAAAIAVLALLFPSGKKLDANIKEFFPLGAVQYLRTHPQQGHIFNMDAWGGYLEWNLPQVQTFYDSRVDIFQEKGVLRDYVDTFSLKQTQEILDRYQVDYVLYATDQPLSYYLSKVPQWERIYADERAVIFRRTAPVQPCKPGLYGE